MILQEVALGGKQTLHLRLVAGFGCCHNAVAEHGHELQFQRDVILGLLPAGQLVQALAAVDRQYLVAGLLHHEALGARVHRLEGVGGRVGIDAVADEGTHVIDGQIGDGVGVGAGQVGGDGAVAGIHGGIARGGGEAHGLQLG